MSYASIGKAFGTAALYWIALWFILVHVFVLWKWNAYSVSPRSQAALEMNRTQASILEPETIVVDQQSEWTVIIDATRTAVDTVEADIHKMQAKQAQLQETLQRMNEALDNVMAKKTLLTNLERELGTWEAPAELTVFVDGHIPPSEYNLEHLTQLLAMPDLAQIDSTKDLQRAFASVSQALDALLQHEESSSSPQWSAITAMLQQEFPSKESTISSCPELPEEALLEDQETGVTEDAENKETVKDDDTTTTPAVTEEDVARRQDEIRVQWDAMYDEDRPLPVSDKEIKRLEKLRQLLLDEWMQRVQASLDQALDKVELAISAAEAAQREEAEAAANEQDLVDEVVQNDGSDDSRKNCAKTDDVMAVLEAGLEAVQRKMDLQDALRQAMSARDANLANVILDADLPLGETRPAITGPQTLRQYLDSAILKHDVPEWIHAILDAVGGHADWLDKWIDTLPENVGEYAVQKALDTSGQVNFNDIRRFKDKYIGELENKISNLL